MIQLYITSTTTQFYRYR